MIQHVAGHIRIQGLLRSGLPDAVGCRSRVKARIRGRRAQSVNQRAGDKKDMLRNSTVQLLAVLVVFIFSSRLGMSGKWKPGIGPRPGVVYIYSIGLFSSWLTLGFWVKSGSLLRFCKAEFVLLGIAIWWLSAAGHSQARWIRTIEAHRRGLRSDGRAVKKGEEWHLMVQDPESWAVDSCARKTESQNRQAEIISVFQRKVIPRRPLRAER